MPNATITLGTQTIDVAPIPLGRLRKLIPAFNRAGRAFAAGQVEEEQLDDVFTVISAGTGKPVSELEDMPGTYSQLMQALDVVATVAGLKPEGPTQGEAVPGTRSPA